MHTLRKKARSHPSDETLSNKLLLEERALADKMASTKGSYEDSLVSNCKSDKSKPSEGHLVMTCK